MQERCLQRQAYDLLRRRAPCSTSAMTARRTMPDNWIVRGNDPQDTDFFPGRGQIEEGIDEQEYNLSVVRP
jgi:hypothetical protein